MSTNTSPNEAAAGERPTLGRVMLRPKWIGALVLALAVAAGFAALGQWQLGSAVQNQVTNTFDTELPVKLEDLTSPNVPVGDSVAGQVVAATGRWVVEDYSVVTNRVNQGEVGYWVVGHLVTAETPAAHVVVALGWTADADTAETVIAQLQHDEASTGIGAEVMGRYMPTEEPVVPKPSADPLVVTSLSVAQQANLWQPFTGYVYGGFIVSHSPVDGLELIDSVPPLPQETINWLNLFYAIEWVVFAGFALYFWYRIAKDAWQKELDELDELDATATNAAGAASIENPQQKGQ